MVCSALDDISFNKPPCVLKNCVRVYYNKGYHVDIPVYRKFEDGSLELASSYWKGSSPSEITEWYNKAVCELSPDTINGRQLRRVTRLLKAFKDSRDSWKNRTASGFVVSVLVVENYISNDRDDISMLETMNAVYYRLLCNLEVKNPVRNEMLTKGVDESHTKFLREKLREALDHLEILSDDQCTRLEALKHGIRYFRTISDRTHKYEESKQKKARILREGKCRPRIICRITATTATLQLDRSNREAYGNR